MKKCEWRKIFMKIINFIKFGFIYLLGKFVLELDLIVIARNSCNLKRIEKNWEFNIIAYS
jgi:hypothetical protein